jgi:polyhydroxyalkanoate synthase
MAQYLAAQVPDWQPEAMVVAEIGSSRLLDFGGEGEVVLLIPPLINKANILDLSAEMSFVEKLKKNAHVYLLDWGVPSAEEKDFAGADYVKRLADLAAHIEQPLHLLGYCMGGLLALRAAQELDLKSIILLATPWNFEYLQTKAKPFTEFAAAFPADFVPPEIIQTLFFSIDPWRVFNKFSSIPAKTEAAQAKFFAVEKWANDGVAMPKPIFTECINGWIGKNDKGFSLAEIKIPVLAACPKNDRIVPLEASLAVAGELRNCTIRQFDCGHIGLVTKDIAVETIFKWLRENA